MTLTAQGFKRKRYDDFITEMQDQAKEIFGADVNLTDAGPLGRWIKMIAYARAEENEQAEAIYLSAFYDAAEGISLDYVAKNIGIQRMQAQKAKGQIQATVEVGQTISEGLIVSTTDEIEFITTETVTDEDADGIVTINIEALEAGTNGNVPGNTITEISTPVAGLESVTNPTGASGGTNKETDAELRNRYAQSISKGGSSTLDGIKAALLSDVEGIRAAVVIENNENTVDADGRAPHSFEAVVLGGNADDIGKTILKSKPAGIRAYGGRSVIVEDDSGNQQTIGYSLAQEVDVYVNIQLTTDASFPTDGQNMVKSKVIEYIGGVDANGDFYNGLGMGADVILFQVERAVGKIDGVVDAVVTLSTDNATFNPSNIAIETTQVAQTDDAKVVIS